MASSVRLIITAALLVGVAGCGGNDESATTSGGSSSSAGNEPITLSIGYTPIADEAVLKIASAQGIFEKHGLKVKYTAAAPGTALIAQLLNGQVDVGVGALTGVMAAVSQKIPVAAVSAVSRDYETEGQTAYATMVASDSGVSSFKDLEGKTVAVNSLQGIWEITTREAVAQDGGDPKKVKLTQITFGDQVAALRSGRVDAISTLQPVPTVLASQGYKRLGDAQAIAAGDPETVATVAFMTKAKIQKQPEAPKRWVAAIAEASEYANAHPDEVKKVIISESKAPAEAINEAPVPVFTPAIPRANVDVFSKLMVKYGGQKVPVTADQVLWDGVPGP